MTKSTTTMTSTDDDNSNHRIAIPVTLLGWEELQVNHDNNDNADDSWRILGRGQEEMPFSTAKFAA
jgi:hypothetical protein